MSTDFPALYQLVLLGLQQVGHDTAACPDEENEQWASDTLAELLDEATDDAAAGGDWRDLLNIPPSHPLDNP